MDSQTRNHLQSIVEGASPLTDWQRLRTSAKLKPHYGKDVYAEGRGIEYSVEWYEASDNYGIWEAALVVHAIRIRDRKKIWSGPARIGSDDTFLAAIRDARRNR